MPWLEAFKLALIKEDNDELVLLIEKLPQFNTEKEMLEASLLIDQAIVFFKTLEKNASIEMHKIHKAKKYLQN